MLTEFRARLAGDDAGGGVFDAVLTAAREAGLVKPGKRQRTDVTHVLAATRDLNRLEFAVETPAQIPLPGLAKTRLQHHFTGAVTNLARLDAWLTGRPLARTRVSPFAAIRPAG